MEGAARTRIVALVVLLALAVPLGVVAVAGSGGGDDPEQGDLWVERSPQLPELLVYVTPEANKPERAGGRGSVVLECVDPEGGVVITRTEPWPFTDTDQNTIEPHTHVPVDPARIGDITSCRLEQTQPPLEGPVS
jgi:hypothetical protein